MTKRYALLVGMHFRPPAKWILARLPAKVPLIVEPEPSNQYDPDAQKVLVRTTSLPEGVWHDVAFAEELVGCGLTPEELKQVETVWLGYAAKEANKALQGLQLPGKISAKQLGDLIKDREHEARLAFGLGGEPLIEITLPEGTGT